MVTLFNFFQFNHRKRDRGIMLLKNFPRPSSNPISVKKLPHYFKLFLVYLDFSQITFTFFFKPHFKYKLLFGLSIYDNMIYINTSKLYKR